MLGQISTGLAFGDEYGAATVLLPVVFAGVAAAAIAVGWIRFRRPGAARLISAAVALGVMAACIQTVNAWHIGDGPVTSGHAPARCLGTAPRVCMAQTGGAVENLLAVRQQVVDSIEKLQAAGVAVRTPAQVDDSLLRERAHPQSTVGHWWLPLSTHSNSNETSMTGVRYAVLLNAVRFPCRFPASFEVGKSADWIVNRDASMLWAAYVLDADRPYMKWRKSEYGALGNPQQVLAAVEKRAAAGRKLPDVTAQSKWFHNEQDKACRLLREGEQT